MQDKTILSCTAIMGIVILNAVALFMGFNGTLLTSCAATIAGIAGYSIKSVRG